MVNPAGTVWPDKQLSFKPQVKCVFGLYWLLDSWKKPLAKTDRRPCPHVQSVIRGKTKKQKSNNNTNKTTTNKWQNMHNHRHGIDITLTKACLWWKTSRKFKQITVVDGLSEIKYFLFQLKKLFWWVLSDYVYWLCQQRELQSQWKSTTCVTAPPCGKLHPP